MTSRTYVIFVVGGAGVENEDITGSKQNINQQELTSGETRKLGRAKPFLSQQLTALP